MKSMMDINKNQQPHPAQIKTENILDDISLLFNSTPVHTASKLSFSSGSTNDTLEIKDDGKMRESSGNEHADLHNDNEVIANVTQSIMKPTIDNPQVVLMYGYCNNKNNGNSILNDKSEHFIKNPIKESKPINTIAKNNQDDSDIFSDVYNNRRSKDTAFVYIDEGNTFMKKSMKDNSNYHSSKHHKKLNVKRLDETYEDRLPYPSHQGELTKSDHIYRNEIERLSNNNKKLKGKRIRGDESDSRNIRQSREYPYVKCDIDEAFSVSLVGCVLVIVGMCMFTIFGIYLYLSVKETCGKSEYLLVLWYTLYGTNVIAIVFIFICMSCISNSTRFYGCCSLQSARRCGRFVTGLICIFVITEFLFWLFVSMVIFYLAGDCYYRNNFQAFCAVVFMHRTYSEKPYHEFTETYFTMLIVSFGGSTAIMFGLVAILVGASMNYMKLSWNKSNSDYME